LPIRSKANLCASSGTTAIRWCEASSLAPIIPWSRRICIEGARAPRRAGPECCAFSSRDDCPDASPAPHNPALRPPSRKQVNSSIFSPCDVHLPPLRLEPALPIPFSNWSSEIKVSFAIGVMLKLGHGTFLPTSLF
jgi:hypothetical protein